MAITGTAAEGDLLNLNWAWGKESADRSRNEVDFSDFRDSISQPEEFIVMPHGDGKLFRSRHDYCDFSTWIRLKKLRNRNGYEVIETAGRCPPFH